LAVQEPPEAPTPAPAKVLVPVQPGARVAVQVPAVAEQHAPIWLLQTRAWQAVGPN